MGQAAAPAPLASIMLVANPDMLMVGIRKDPVTTIYNEIHRFCRFQVAHPDERGLARQIFESTGHDLESLIIQRAIDVARVLMNQDHTEEQMWVVILGVWVEMLCFSAGSGRGCQKHWCWCGVHVLCLASAVICRDGDSAREASEK